MAGSACNHSTLVRGGMTQTRKLFSLPDKQSILQSAELWGRSKTFIDNIWGHCLQLIKVFSIDAESVGLDWVYKPRVFPDQIAVIFCSVLFIL